jgi:WD40-like Beta Propeller Repeat
MRGTRILGRRIGAAAILVAGLVTAPIGLAGAAGPAADGKIAFSDGVTGQVYSVNPDGSDLAQLTHVSAGHLAAGPAWSPDGTHLAFFSDLTGELRIHVMAADGTGRRLVFQDQPGFRDFAPRYFPTGRSVVFARCKPNNGVCAIYSVRLDGTQLTALTAFKEGAREAVDFFAAPSPDGRRIAFTRFGAHGITSQDRGERTQLVSRRAKHHRVEQLLPVGRAGVRAGARRAAPASPDRDEVPTVQRRVELLADRWPDRLRQQPIPPGSLLRRPVHHERGRHRTDSRPDRVDRGARPAVGAGDRRANPLITLGPGPGRYHC